MLSLSIRKCKIGQTIQLFCSAIDFIYFCIGGASIALSIICYPFVSPALRKVCLPYVPATNVQIQNVLSVIKGRKGKVVDLGSGDGRIV